MLPQQTSLLQLTAYEGEVGPFVQHLRNHTDLNKVGRDMNGYYYKESRIKKKKKEEKKDRAHTGIETANIMYDLRVLMLEQRYHNLGRKLEG